MKIKIIEQTSWATECVIDTLTSLIGYIPRLWKNSPYYRFSRNFTEPVLDLERKIARKKLRDHHNDLRCLTDGDKKKLNRDYSEFEKSSMAFVQSAFYFAGDAGLFYVGSFSNDSVYYARDFAFMVGFSTLQSTVEKKYCQLARSQDVRESYIASTLPVIRAMSQFGFSVLMQTVFWEIDAQAFCYFALSAFLEEAVRAASGSLFDYLQKKEPGRASPSNQLSKMLITSASVSLSKIFLVPKLFGFGSNFFHREETDRSRAMTLFGFQTDPTRQALEKRYHALARKFHPDAGGNHEAMLELNEAYDCLL